MAERETPLAQWASMTIMAATLVVLFFILGRLGAGAPSLNAASGGPLAGGTARKAPDAESDWDRLRRARDRSSQLLGAVPTPPSARPALSAMRQPEMALPPRRNPDGGSALAGMDEAGPWSLPRRPSPWDAGRPENQPSLQPPPSSAAGGVGGAGSHFNGNGGFYVVEPGDTLPKIAEKLLGDKQMGGRIMGANPELRAALGRLEEGMVLKIPSR